MRDGYLFRCRTHALRGGGTGVPIAGPLTAAKFRPRALGDARRIGKSVSPPTQLPAFVQLASNPTWAPRAPCKAEYPVVAVPDRMAPRSVIRSVRVITIRVIVRP